MTRRPVTRMTRVYSFSASHRLHSEQLSPDENRVLYGKCNNPHGHGHNYLLHITVAGEPDPETGRVVNPGALDRFVQGSVVDVFDHKDMNLDVPDFQGVPTTENLLCDAERRLRASWPFAESRLESIQVQETPRNIFRLRTR